MEINSQLIIDRLSQRMDLDRAYLFKYQFLGQEHYHLLLALKHVSGLSPKVLKPIVGLCLMDQKNISFELVPIAEMLSKVKVGSLYYSYASLPENTVHQAGNKKNPPLQAKELKSVLEIADEYYQKLLPISAGFLQGAETFGQQGNYQRAVFMLHQSMENHLRFLQLMIDGKANNVHHVSNRIKSLNEHFSMLRESLVGKDEEEKKRFRLLDSAFDAVKQNKDLEISAFDASWLYEHCKFVLHTIEQLYLSFMEGLKTGYEKLLAIVEQKVANKNVEVAVGNLAAKETTLSNAAASQFHAFPWPDRYEADILHVLAQIRQENNPEQMMLLNYYVSDAHGKGLFHFPAVENEKAEIYLVVIKKKIGHCHFRKIVYGRVTAVVAFMSTDFLATKLDLGSRFSHTIWNESVVVYRRPSYKPTYPVSPINWHDTLFKTSISWTRNSKLMQDLLGVFAFEGLASSQLAVLFLNQLTSIGLYSYLYLRIGYAPMNVTIADLVDWTCICDKKVKEFFTARGDVEEILNAELLKQMKGRIYELPSQLAQLDMDYFRSKAKEITDFFVDLCDQSIRYMELKSEAKLNEVI